MDAKNIKWAIVDDSDRVAVIIIDDKNTEEPLVFKTRKAAKDSFDYYPERGDKIRKVTEQELQSILDRTYSYKDSKGEGYYLNFKRKGN